ncbi:adenylate/guanylate cyclase domain-containing protein [Geitlerinema sp. PCC 7407]|uniref:adenylate/guanylate cyclase domain-containing protein n=1 Tax=Geitlerinema sp. PCC 7407 TaxID=1173025 RepID=UPI00029FCD39|nr:adenylate/guanylate cyclase domain-containing protein [Geitlerinema sp. PCC 7407]AFY64969.1 adenylate/guanylate cyclase [Geitlerinema sp. PCC 7407]
MPRDQILASLTPRGLLRRFILRPIQRLIYRRTVLLLVLLVLAGGLAAFWNTSRLASNLVETQALRNATLYAQVIQEARTLYNTDVVQRLEQSSGVTVTHAYREQEGAVPLPATYLIELGHRIEDTNSGMVVRLFSNYPFPWRQATGGPQDDFERAAIAQLQRDPQTPFTRLETFNGQASFRYAQADILKASCVNCHNQHPDSPKRDWKAGDVRGILEIITPLDSVIEQTREGLRGTALTMLILSVLALVGLLLVIGRLRQTSQELELRVADRTLALRETNAELAREQQKAEQLLLNILPQPIAEKLKQGHNHIANGFSDVTILFADIVGFTELSAQIAPEQLVGLLNEIFSAFDHLTEQFGLEKIKTIGDAYMVVGGLPMPRPDHAEAIAEMALAMLEAVEHFNQSHDFELSIRIGINTGPVVAGVIGTKKFIYDLWGDTVNVASRMESHGLPNGIQVTASTYECLRDRYEFEERGPIDVRGRGSMVTYWLTGKVSSVPVV